MNGYDRKGFDRRTGPETRLENVGYGSTVAAMAVAVTMVLGVPAIADLGTYLAGWTESCATALTVAAHALGFYG